MNTENGSRRDFIKKAGLGTAAMAALGKDSMAKSVIAQTKLPRWRGFNLMEIYTYRNPEEIKLNEDDFRMISDLGFDFLRLPLKYMMWINWDRSRPINLHDVYNINERGLEVLDQLVRWGEQYGLHVNVGLHHGPGYCINAGPEEAFYLWRDQDAQDAFCFHWSLLAQRYRFIPSSRISFNLLNEPSIHEDPLDQHTRRSKVPHQIYTKVVTAATKAVREANPEHLVIVDYSWPQLVDLGVAQSCHAYAPGYLTHYQASWAGHRDATVPPTWPGDMDGEYWDRKRLAENYSPYIELARQGVGIHCGECGCYTRTPHDVVLAWFRDILEILTDAGIGYSLWNFRGAFGIMDNNRPDVNYEDWQGHKLDRKLLDLLLEF